MKSEIANFISEWLWPIFGIGLISTIIGLILANMDNLIDKTGSGTRKDALISMAWIIFYVICAMAVIAGAVVIINKGANTIKLN